MNSNIYNFFLIMKSEQEKKGRFNRKDLERTRIIRVETRIFLDFRFAIHCRLVKRKLPYVENK
jgi:hypothetical protein